MYKQHAMNRNELLAFISANKRVFVLIFCVLFGVVSGESYNILKNPNRPKFKNMLHRIFVAGFVCFVSTPIYDYFKSIKDYYPYFIMVLAAIAMQVMDWFISDFIPMLLSACKQTIIKMLTNRDKMPEKRQKNEL